MDETALRISKAGAPPGRRRAAPVTARHGDGSGPRTYRGLAVALAASAAVVFGRVAGVLDGPAGLLLAVALLVAVPTATHLAGSCATLALWWWELPLGPVGRVTVLLASGAAGLGWWVGGTGARPTERLRRLVPVVELPDALVLVWGAMATYVAAGWLLVRDGAAALASLLGAWDYSAHFNMASMVQSHGVTVDGLVPLAGEIWKFTEYPQGYQAVVAALVALLGGPAPGDVGSELVRYARGQGLLLIAFTVLLVSAVPRWRQTRWAAVPATALVAATVALGPGARAFADGYPNFVMAAVLSAAVVLVAVTTARPVAPFAVATLGGPLLGVTQAWMALLALAVPTAMLALFPLRGGRRSAGRAEWAVDAVLAVAGVSASCGSCASWAPSTPPRS